MMSRRLVWTCQNDPRVPTTTRGAPSWSSIQEFSVCTGRLPGGRLLGLKQPMRLLSRMPVSPATTPFPA